MTEDSGVPRLSDFRSFMLDGPFRSHVVDHRLAGGSGAFMALTHQPAGSYPAPATPDLVLRMVEDWPIRASVDLGAGRFRSMIQPGEFMVTPPATPMDMTVAEHHRIMVLAVPFVRLRELCPGIDLGSGGFGGLHTRTIVDPFVSFLLRRLWQEAKHVEPAGSLFIDTALTALGLGLHRLAGPAARTPVAGGSYSGGLATRALRRVIELVESSLDRDIPLADMAATAGLSPFHFARAFKQSTGLTPHRYVMARRIERARDLLARTVLPVSEIALACGFQGTGYFATLFRRETGLTPREFRRRALFDSALTRPTPRATGSHPDA